MAAPALVAHQSDAQRDRWQRVEDVFAALAIGPGSVVADVGAGAGFFTLRLARRVEPNGRVVAVDIDSAVVARLSARVSREGPPNVTVIRSLPDDPKLPAAELDAVLVVNAYHEFSDVEAMVAGFRRALKAGGRVAIIDQVPSGDLMSERARQERAHELGSWFAIRDLRRAGFEIVRVEDPFIRRDPAGTGATQDWWLVVAQFSASTPGGERP
ncbi:MAG TPA: methyltransferase domain-containing protein [Gemmatimonadales bacterium]